MLKKWSNLLVWESPARSLQLSALKIFLRVLTPSLKRVKIALNPGWDTGLWAGVSNRLYSAHRASGTHP